MHRVLCEPLFKEVLYVCFRLNENKLSFNKRCPCRHLTSNNENLSKLANFKLLIIDYNLNIRYIDSNTFKTWYNGHTNSFRNEKYRNATTLSNYIWTLNTQKHKLLTKVENHRQRKGLSAPREKLWPLWPRKILHNIKTRTSKPKPEKSTLYLLQT